jgi:hypothetical protein
VLVDACATKSSESNEIIAQIATNPTPSKALECTYPSGTHDRFNGDVGELMLWSRSTPRCGISPDAIRIPTLVCHVRDEIHNKGEWMAMGDEANLGDEIHGDLSDGWV